MTLLIQENESNIPQNDPCTKENLKQAFPSLDWDSSVPSGWMKFERIDSPVLSAYQKYDSPQITYEVIDGVVKDVWHILNMTDDEKKTKQDRVKADWAALDPAGPASWTFDEATCSYQPPVAYPSDGKNYEWDESSTSWEEIT